MVIIVGIPLGIVVGVVAFIKFPIELLRSTFKSINEDVEFEKIQKNKLLAEEQKDIWEKHIERMNNN